MGSRTTTTSSTRTFQSSKAPQEAPKTPRNKLQLRLRKVKFSPWLLVIALILFSIFMVAQYHQAKNKLQKSAPAVAAHQVDDVVARVGKLIILPKGVKPSTVATVSNTDKLKNQEFFADARVGDKVLIYTQQKKAILYRPSTNQLVNVAAATVSSTGEANVTTAPAP